jgi:hypothetical protein
MNARIIELAKQAGYQSDSFGVGPWEMSEFQTFVNLLVECDQVALFQRESDYFEEYDDLNNYDRFLDDTASKISGEILSKCLWAA